MHNAVRKLHVGAGQAWLPGWLNSDYSPFNREVIYLDATERLPFPDASFHYVFSEHMLEHIPYAKGEFFLAECKRILCPGGKVRVSTPNLARFASMYCSPERQEHKQYIEWALRLNSLPQRARHECFVLNNFVRSWGHQFIYDEETLKALLESLGFCEVTEVSLGQSTSAHLAGLERHGEAIGEQYNRFETMILEATKPLRSLD